MIETMIAAFFAFIGTNIDDMLINTLFFSASDGKGKVRSVVVGKYLGIGALLLVSILGALGLHFVPEQHIGILGLLPIILGIKEMICYLRKRNDGEFEAPPQKTNLLIFNVMFVTLANGADNIGVYIPLFASYRPWQFIVVVCVFAVMIALWCFLGKKLSDLPFLRDFLNKYKHILIPVVYIALGMYIIVKNVI